MKRGVGIIELLILRKHSFLLTVMLSFLFLFSIMSPLSGIARADVVYEFLYDGDSISIAFVYTNPDFISAQLEITDMGDFDSLTPPSGYSCDFVGFYPDYSTPNEPDLIAMTFESWYLAFYFPDGSFSAYDVYSSTSGAGGAGAATLRVKYAMPAPTGVPEPGTMLLLGSGLLGLWGLRRKFKK